MRTKSLLGAAAAALTLAVPATAAADANPYAKGPDPTAVGLRTVKGPYDITKTFIPNAVTVGFGAATVWAPTGPAAAGQTFGAIAIVPGFTESEAAVAWMGPRFASQGFVVITINTNNIFDQPVTRGHELVQALNYLTGTSASKGIVDPTRQAVVGHSMGGGGTLEATRIRPTLKAAVALAPWDQTKNWSTLKTPTMIISSENDVIAPISSHAIPFYNSFAPDLPKAYLELNNADHFASTKSNTTVALEGISWLKRFVDDDTRYTQFICPTPLGIPNGALSNFRSNCAF
jgi:pimeloyl-ACP methyl ester carboxylesterase